MPMHRHHKRTAKRPLMSRFSFILEPGLLLAAALLASVLGMSPACAQIARLELRPLPSTTLTDQEFLTGQKEGRPVILAGELRIPTPGTSRLPAVVLLHGSGGVGGL